MISIHLFFPWYLAVYCVCVRRCLCAQWNLIQRCQDHYMADQQRNIVKRVKNTHFQATHLLRPREPFSCVAFSEAPFKKLSPCLPVSFSFSHSLKKKSLHLFLICFSYLILFLIFPFIFLFLI